MDSFQKSYVFIYPLIQPFNSQEFPIYLIKTDIVYCMAGTA